MSPQKPYDTYGQNTVRMQRKRMAKTISQSSRPAVEFITLRSSVSASGTDETALSPKKKKP